MELRFGKAALFAVTVVLTAQAITETPEDACLLQVATDFYQAPRAKADVKRSGQEVYNEDKAATSSISSSPVSSSKVRAVNASNASNGSSTSPAYSAEDLANFWSSLAGGDYAPSTFCNRNMKYAVILAAVYAFGAIAIEVAMRSWHREVAENELPGIPPEAGLKWSELHFVLRPLVFPFFTSKEGMIGRWCLFTILASAVVSIIVGVIMTEWNKEFWNMLSYHDQATFPQFLQFFAMIFVVDVLNSVYSGYLASWLTLDWRTFLTKEFVGQWLQNHAHYKLQTFGSLGTVDNPEQRIQDDIGIFVTEFLILVPGFFLNFGNMIMFIPIILKNEPELAFGLFRLPGWMVIFTALWSTFGSVATHFIGSNLVRLNFIGQVYSAEFRAQGIHVRLNSGSIALYNSAPREESSMHNRFKDIIHLTWTIMLLERNMGYFLRAYGFAKGIVPWLLLAPSYLKGDISVGTMIQLQTAIGVFGSTLDWFVKSYATLASFRATAYRLLIFQGALDIAQKIEGKNVQKAFSPELDRLIAHIGEVHLPGGQLLWSQLHLEIPRGRRVLITGPEGSGKSLLIKVLAGIWPHVSDVDVQIPTATKDDVLFVPHRPALPPRCSLAEALSYPEPVGTYSDAALLKMLCTVSLDELAIDMPDQVQAKEVHDVEAKAADDVEELRHGKMTKEALYYEDSWSSRLSPGQQQRLLIGHVLLKRPQVLFIDEVTSNLSKEAAQALYGMLIATLPRDGIIVSISHDVDALGPLHDCIYRVSGEGNEKTLTLADK